MKYLIINADDFGYSKSINRGIIECYDKGVVTSTSVMVYGKAVEEVSELRGLTNLSVGLHLHMEKAFENPEDEFNKQIARFKQLFGNAPSHIDVHRPRSSNLSQFIDLLANYSKANRIPIRELGHAKTIKDFFGLDVAGDGKFDEKRITVEALLKILGNIGEGVSEIMCHVGYSDDELRKLSTYNDPREVELKTLTDPRIIDYLHNTDDLKLINWKNASIQI